MGVGGSVGEATKRKMGGGGGGEEELYKPNTTHTRDLGFKSDPNARLKKAKKGVGVGWGEWEGYCPDRDLNLRPVYSASYVFFSSPLSSCFMFSFFNNSCQLLPQSLTLSCCLVHYDLCYCSRLPLIVFKTGLVYTGQTRPFRIVDLPSTMTIDAFHMQRLRKGNTANQNGEKNSKWSRLRSDVAGVVVNDILGSLPRFYFYKHVWIRSFHHTHSLIHTLTHARTHTRTHTHTRAHAHTPKTYITGDRLVEWEERKRQVSIQKRRSGFSVLTYKNSQWRRIPDRQRKKVPDHRSDVLKGSHPRLPIC